MGKAVRGIHGTGAVSFYLVSVTSSTWRALDAGRQEYMLEPRKVASHSGWEAGVGRHLLLVSVVASWNESINEGKNVARPPSASWLADGTLISLGLGEKEYYPRVPSCVS